MKTMTVKAIVAAVMALGIATMVGIETLPTMAQTPTSQAQGIKRHGGRERHPEIRRALKHLMMAQSNLKAAAHDFNGNREKALDLTQQAISACQAALQADKN